MNLRHIFSTGIMCAQCERQNNKIKLEISADSKICPHICVKVETILGKIERITWSSLTESYLIG